MVSSAQPTLERLMASARTSRTPGRSREIVVSDDAIDAIAPWLADNHPEGDDIIVCDDHTWKAAGQRVEAALQAAGRTHRLLVLEPRDGDDHLVCEDGVITSLATVLAATKRGRALAVGAGTINDIVKMASFELGRDYVVVPTAASMNGYTSLIGAVLVDGVKRTLPAQQPIALFCDLGVLRAAPPVLNRAGFGDLLSKPFSDADWRLSAFVRDVPYDPAPAALLDEIFAQLVDKARAVGRADEDGIRVLVETILLSGFSMTIAGTSAPASGGEHLISHYWDMEQLHLGLPLQALHGTQVGVATRISAHLYARLMALDLDTLDLDALVARRADASWLQHLDQLHTTLSAEIVEEIRQQLTLKQRHGDALRAELLRLRSGWRNFRDALAPTLLSPAQITRALRDAGCADRASTIGVDRARLARTIRLCRHIRSRYVALDLIDDLGLLEPWADAAVSATEG